MDVSDRKTDWADAEGGNYWSRYRGYDLDHDGLGDVPFSIQNVFQVLESKVPEVRFYLLSPAAEVLKAAEQALPILRLGDSEDPLPKILPLDNHEVPWDVVSGRSEGGSLVAAGAFVVGSTVPMAGLWFFGRPRRRRRGGPGQAS